MQYSASMVGQSEAQLGPHCLLSSQQSLLFSAACRKHTIADPAILQSSKIGLNIHVYLLDDRVDKLRAVIGAAV